MTALRTVVITNTSPLLTLARAGALDTLLLLGLPIEIPDAVYFEATRVAGAPGAMSIVEWMETNSAARIAVTETGIDQFRRIEEGRPIRGLGEAAALELLGKLLDRDPAAGVLLIFEDTDVEKRRAFMEERAELISTGDLHFELEAAGRIQSADAILDAAAASGRNVDRQRRSRAADHRSIRDR